MAKSLPNWVVFLEGSSFVLEGIVFESVANFGCKKFAEENLPKMNKNDLVNYDAIINGNYMEWDLYYYLTGRKEAPNELISNPLFKNMKEYILLNNQRKIKWEK
uniref:Uncharacterized protein n=1 Tax=Meloidogyne incognita TaxID=6306 RepID=A0A914NHJ7_MELIC